MPQLPEMRVLQRTLSLKRGFRESRTVTYGLMKAVSASAGRGRQSRPRPCARLLGRRSVEGAQSRPRPAPRPEGDALLTYAPDEGRDEKIRILRDTSVLAEHVIW